MKYKVIAPKTKPTSFESLTFSATSGQSTVVVLLIYRPGSSAVTDVFFNELTSILETLFVFKCQILISGDLNIHVEKTDDVAAVKLATLLASFDCVQHVSQPTHAAGGILDLVITRSDQKLCGIDVDPHGIISDHGLVTFNLALDVQCPINEQRTVRNWKKVDRTLFRQAINESLLTQMPDDASSDELFTAYHTVLTSLVD